LLARIYEYQKNWNLAIGARNVQANLDPYNQIVLLQLGEDYKSAGNFASAHSVIARIQAFAPGTKEEKQAIADFGK
jgi:hypothetical protein